MTAPTVTSRLQTMGEGLREIAENLDNDHLFLAAIEEINSLAGQVYELIDPACEDGTMSREKHGDCGSAAGVAASAAIAVLLDIRKGLQYMAEDLNRFARLLAQESEAAQ